MGIDLVQIRAIITIGSLIVKTPYIQSFNVRKSRGQPSSFDATLKVPYSDVGDLVNGLVVIKAGTNEKKNKIFTGIVKKVTISPCWDDPGYIILKISGTDILSNLKNKEYSRRCRASKSTWISIDNVVRRGIRASKFELDADSLNIDGGNVMEYYSKNANQTESPNVSGNVNPATLNAILVKVSNVVSIA